MQPQIPVMAKKRLRTLQLFAEKWRQRRFDQRAMQWDEIAEIASMFERGYTAREMSDATGKHHNFFYEAWCINQLPVDLRRLFLACRISKNTAIRATRRLTSAGRKKFIAKLPPKKQNALTEREANLLIEQLRP